MKGSITAKYRKAKKELHLKQRAKKNKRHEIRLKRDKLKALNCTPPKDKPIGLKVTTVILDEHEPDEVLNKRRAALAEVPVVPAARRAFQDD